MKLDEATSSVYMAFQNTGSRAVFGVAFPSRIPRSTPNRSCHRHSWTLLPDRSQRFVLRSFFLCSD